MTQTAHKDGRRAFRLRFRLPDSLFGQLLCLLVLGIVIFQVTNVLVVCSVQHLYIRQAEKTRAEHLTTCWFLFDAMTSAQRREAVARMSDLGRPEQLREMVEILPDRPDWGGAECAADRSRVERLQRMVEDSFGRDSKVQPPVLARRHADGTGIFPMHLPVLETAIRLSDGTWLKVTQPLDVDDRLVVWSQRLTMLLTGLIMLAVVAAALVRATKPIERLSRAAEAFGRHPELSEPLPEQGVREVRNAAQSFNRMRERICGNLAERDRMLAAMAHDLRTPLTRLQLRLDRVEPGELRLKLQKTVSAMRAILSQGLELARSLNTEEVLTRLDMRSFLQSVADDHADEGCKVIVRADEDEDAGAVIVQARPLCLRRCLENLISNACTYGGSAEIGLAREGEHIVVSIADSGPGIPEEMLGRVLEPYVRLDSSRNAASGGTGLGLAIARNMALLNNGELELANRPEGGLVARVILPAGR